MSKAKIQGHTNLAAKNCQKGGRPRLCPIRQQHKYPHPHSQLCHDHLFCFTTHLYRHQTKNSRCTGIWGWKLFVFSEWRPQSPLPPSYPLTSKALAGTPASHSGRQVNSSTDPGVPEAQQCTGQQHRSQLSSTNKTNTKGSTSSKQNISLQIMTSWLHCEI